MQRIYYYSHKNVEEFVKKMYERAATFSNSAILQVFQLEWRLFPKLRTFTSLSLSLSVCLFLSLFQTRRYETREIKWAMKRHDVLESLRIHDTETEFEKERGGKLISVDQSFPSVINERSIFESRTSPLSLLPFDSPSFIHRSFVISLLLLLSIFDFFKSFLRSYKRVNRFAT